ncbi:prophage tail fiber N-terminal domain-containing protein [Vibrio fluvialis]|uniref:prophage tail fiber N-terminal domain-containing protein n=1 Tax=Vibrio fluvialis TaxID=676 RepID=UPI00192AC228|nr:prophage tail fiber N-terminal domain-containing protein [Vibrio fluvialis]MBL4297857.1 prophage tail fiber N-terminal domain-containing protein [Vibrio fluvialis]
MSVRVTGVLTDAGGNIAPNVHIQFTTTQGFGSTLPTAPLDVITGADGGYDFNLVIGTHRISIRYGDRFEPIGTTVINDETPGVLTLSELLKQTAPVTPEALKLIMQYTAEAKAAKEAAGQFAAQAEDNAEQSLVEATKSKQHADQAKIYRDQTAAIATGGTATLEPEPGKIPLADQHGHIDDGWLNAATFARSESDMMADRARNNQLFAASGHIHAGKHRNDVNPVYGRPIQDGLWTYLNNSNVLRLGAYKEQSNVEGDSKTYESVFNMAGVTVHLKGLNSAYENAQLILPPAPKGTEVYDSATGVLTNFETEIDPKYGDVAADTNEAVARAFEGLIKNSDGRLGTVDFVARDCTPAALPNGGGFTITPNVNTQYFEQAISCVIGTKYKAKAVFSVSTEVKGTSSSPFSSLTILNTAKTASIASSVVESGEAGRVYTFDVEFTATETTHFVSCFFNMPVGGGATATVNFVSADLSSREVVTHPVDLVGFEWFLRPINESDPILYPNGIQQCKLTSVDGIPTVENTFRPMSHFEVYPGDTASRGRGWNLFDGSISDAQKAEIFQNPEHNIYRMGDGTLAQWTVSQRTIRGAGNGDWANVNPSNTSLMFCTSKLFVQARGVNDSASPLVLAGSIARYVAPNNSGNVLGGISEKGVFVPTTSVAYNGECYFYVIATVPRLNQGAYHPSLNPFGTALVMSSISNNGAHPWSHANAQDLFTASQCFNFGSLPQVIGEHYAWAESGDIASGISGHPDGLYHDAIYDGGLNGVIDQRLKYGAWDASSSEQAAVVREEVKNGTYRGREKLVRWMISEGTPSASSANMYIGSGFGIGVGESYLAAKSVVELGYKAWVYIVDAGDTTLSGVVTGQWYVCSAFSRNYQKNVTLRNPVTGVYAWITAGNCSSMKIIVGIDVETNITVEGGFTQTDVIGAPANILQVEALKEGWLGSWIPVIPDGGNTWNMFYATRKKISVGAVAKESTSDNGSTWTVSSITWNDVTNSPTSESALPIDRVELWHYTASSKQTEPSSNLSVFNGERGLSSVFASSNYRTANGCLLSESLLGNVLKSDSTLPRDKCYSLTGFTISSSGVLEPSGNMTTHSQIDLSAPTSGDKAFKALYCQSSSDQQANLNIIANELIYSSTGGNWGDDAKLKIVADGTFTDLNGNKCKAVIHKLAKPYGFIKL